MKDIKKDNHYVPQFYLKQWSYDTKNIYVYRRLVSHKKVPYWSEESIKYIAKQLHLYTEYLAGNEIYDFELWFNSNYETPVQSSYLKALNDFDLNDDDLKILIDYTASQIVRTPKFYFTSNRIVENAFNYVCENRIPEIMENITKKIENDKNSIPLQSENNKYSNLSDIIKSKIDKENGIVEVSIILGRDSWLANIKHLLLNTSKVLYEHHWSIITMDNAVEIPTSDDPVICLNYYSHDKYNFGGGWNYPGSEIIFPLSPQKILYTKVGNKFESKLTMSKEESLIIKNLIMNHSYRYLYSREKIKFMFKQLPREINIEKYNWEKESWLNWNENQKIDNNID